MTLLGIGMAVGVAAALLASKLLSGLVFGIEVTDLSTYALSALALAVVGLTACFIPAQRATKVDPMAALRHD
jgi:putative ABC transport system permease protein